jgi:hypothetical protein
MLDYEFCGKNRHKKREEDFFHPPGAVCRGTDYTHNITPRIFRPPYDPVVPSANFPIEECMNSKYRNMDYNIEN